MGIWMKRMKRFVRLGNRISFLQKKKKNRDNGRIFVKKYVAASVIPVYEKLIAIRNEHLENIYDFAAGEEREF